jgi:sulfite reductase alpha subunit-like flavoprotein
MLGQSSLSRGGTAENRIFVYEVTGLQQNAVVAQCEYKIRNSSSTFLQVPLDRMSKTMQRIVNLGGKIVSIRPVEAESYLPESHDQSDN